MEPKFQSSFIPKGPAAPAASYGAPASKLRSSLFGYIATTVFVIAVLAAIGVFGYQRYLVSSIDTMGNNLNTARATLEPDVVNQLVKTSDRLAATQALLNQHMVVSPLFDYIEQNTLKSVSFTDFEFATNDKGLTLKMEGLAQSYTAVALQSAAFNKSPFFQNPVFSNLDLDAKGNVIFVFQANLNPAMLMYRSEFNSAAPQANPVSLFGTTTLATTTPLSASTTASTTKP